MDYNGKIPTNGLVLVDFWGDWCGPCKKMHEILKEVDSQRKDQITIVKVNCETHYEFAKNQGVKALPHIQVFKDGKIAYDKAGFLPLPAINAILG
jgi:thioredoxin